MRPLYAARLTVMPKPGDAVSEHHERVTGIARSWLQRVAAPFGGPELEPTSTGRFRGTIDPRCVGELRQSVDGGASAWHAELSHPYRRPNNQLDATTAMRSVIQVYSEGAESTVTVRIMAHATVDRVAPSPTPIKPPRLVRELIDRFPVQIGNVEVRPEPWPVDAARVDRLVGRLTQHDRLIPIVVVSRRPDGACAAAPEDLCHALAGIAQVAVLADAHAAYRLTDQVGKHLSCYAGAIRIYWPGFAIDADPYQHRLWLADAIETRALGPAMPKILFATIGDVAVSAYGADTRVRDIEQRAMQTRLADVTARLAALEQEREAGRDAADTLDDALNELRDWIAEAQTLQEQLEDAQRREQELREELHRQRLTFAAVGPESEAPTAAERVAPSSLVEVLRQVAREYGGQHVVVLASAYESAEQSPYRIDFQRAADALACVFSVAEGWHTGTLGKSIGQTFRDLGQDYSAKVSRSTAGESRSRYTRSYKGETRWLDEHLKVGKGNPEDSLRIHWFRDESDRAFVLAHVGRHLPDSTTG